MSALLLAAGLGWTSGMRSVAAPAALAASLAAHPRRARRQPARVLANPASAGLLGLAALGETVLDKAPWAPDRTSPPALGGRLAAGALAGAVVARARGSSVLPATLAGMLGAAGGAFAMIEVRRRAAERFGAWPAALTEDALAHGAAGWLARRVIRG